MIPKETGNSAKMSKHILTKNLFLINAAAVCNNLGMANCFKEIESQFVKPIVGMSCQGVASWFLLLRDSIHNFHQNVCQG